MADPSCEDFKAEKIFENFRNFLLKEDWVGPEGEPVKTEYPTYGPEIPIPDQEVPEIKTDVYEKGELIGKPLGYLRAPDGKLLNIPNITGREVNKLNKFASYMLGLASKLRLPYGNYVEFEVDGKKYAAQVVKHYKYAKTGKMDPGGHKSISVFYKPTK